jgi:hypothetical protein
MEDTSLRRQMSEAAINSSKRFSVDIFVEQVLAIYQSQIEVYKKGRTGVAFHSRILNYLRERIANR